jgi:hypothetical protein
MVTLNATQIEAFIQDPSSKEVVGTNVIINPFRHHLDVKFDGVEIGLVRSGNTMYIEIRKGEENRYMGQIEVADETRKESA